MRGSILAMSLLLLAACARPAPAAAQSVPELAAFRSIALSDGGHVTVRHGDRQRVTLLAGEADIRVDGTQLHIARRRTPDHRERLEVEVVAPTLDALSVANGGRLVLAGDFPRQATLAAAVSNGGALDVRAMRAERVTAAVNQGGMIFTRPASHLDAAVSHGGAITYWGNASVSRAVADGGVVQRGRDEEAERPLEAMMPRTHKLLPVAEAPPVPPLPN